MLGYTNDYTIEELLKDKEDGPHFKDGVMALLHELFDATVAVREGTASEAYKLDYNRVQASYASIVSKDAR